MTIRVGDQHLRCPEINFLCVHKKLRSKRLTPVLIKEITRRCNLENIWTAVYTAGIIIPKPVTSCRYFHRSIDWLKLYEVGFSPLPASSTKKRQIAKYNLPDKTATGELRKMERRDVPEVHKLLDRYLKKFDIAPVFTEEEVEHWLVDKEEVVWTYVVEVHTYSPPLHIEIFFKAKYSRTQTHTKLLTSSHSTRSNPPSSNPQSTPSSEPLTSSTTPPRPPSKPAMTQRKTLKSG